MTWFEAYLDEMDVITILRSKEDLLTDHTSFYLIDRNEKIKLSTLNIEQQITEIKYSCKIPIEIDLSKTYYVEDDFHTRIDLFIGSVIRTEKFDQLYFYNGNDLGANYSKEKTTFKVWAPTARQVTLLLYNHKGLVIKEYTMNRENKGVWCITLNGNYEGTLYMYNVCVNNVWRTAVDPYAKGVSVNGEYGVVVDLKKTYVPSQSDHLPPLKNPTDAIIYETHIRDFSIHPESGVKHKGKYIAFCEEGTKGPFDSKTCLDYIVDLGITHIELLPFNDFGGIDETSEEDQYNWGYNPIHYNVPEGSYATDPYDPYVRITETKKMIEALHQKGIRVIMDVVYNHVFVRENSSFRKIVPGYYFRYNEYGFPSNGTGVGNDIASERLMVRKFIVDSVLFWLKEYNVDGFRFDLMGILDVDTMNEVRRAVDSIDPSIIIIGEGWNLDTPLTDEKKAMILNAEKMPRIAHFNDAFRNTMKGSVFNLSEKGFISGHIVDKDKLKLLLAGGVSTSNSKKSLFPAPIHSVNYIESHDNHTLWDKLEISNGEESANIRKKRQYLGIATVLFSLGIPFLHSGMEFFRSKYGDGNSYKSPDNINQLDWARKQMNEAYIPYIKSLISIRKNHPAFRLASAEEVKKHYRWLPLPDRIVGYMLDDLDEIDCWKKIMVIFNNTLIEQEFILPSNSKWWIAIHGEKVDETGLRSIQKKASIPPLSTFMLFQV